MKINLLLKSLVFLVVIGCASPQKLIKNGAYDAAIKMLVKKIISKPDNEKAITELAHAFRVANQINHDSINFLRQTKQPDIWYGLYTNFLILKQRENYVKTLPEKVLKEINFTYTDYDKDLIHAKEKAAAYFYAHSQILLDKENKADARKAYGELMKITDLYDEYKDVDQMIRKALILGTEYILYQVVDRTASILPRWFLYNLENINLMDLDQQFVNFNNKPQTGKKYDYSIVFNLNAVQISPEQIRENKYTETKKVIVDYQVKKDKNGNVVKDASGELVKVPVYQTISCTITEVEMHKSALATGHVDFVNLLQNQVLHSTPVSAETVFHHVMAYSKGDVRACSEKTLELLGRPRLPFPTDDQMLRDLGQKMESTIKKVIWYEEPYFK